MTPKQYGEKYLTREIKELQVSAKSSNHPELTIYEKAIIYKYTSDGYLEVNRKLRRNQGRNTSNFGKLLEQGLQQLPNYAALVYRKVQLTKRQQNVYRNALHNNSFVKERAFLSTSKFKRIAELFPGNTLFIINCKTGKDVEKIAKFGFGDRYNEYEVLFEPNRQFEVLEVNESVKNLLIITMEEV